jgi:hypothetical protein
MMSRAAGVGYPAGYKMSERLRGRKLLSGIGQQNWTKLREAIGPANYQEILDHDQMLDAWAKYYARLEQVGR